MEEKAAKVFRRVIISVCALVGLFLAVIVFDAMFVSGFDLADGWHDIWDLQASTYGEQETPRMYVNFLCAEGRMMRLVPAKVLASKEIKPGHEKIFVYRDRAGLIRFNLVVHPDWPDLTLVPRGQKGEANE